MRCYHCGGVSTKEVEAIVDFHKGGSQRIVICSDACLRKIHAQIGNVRAIPFSSGFSENLFKS